MQRLCRGGRGHISSCPAATHVRFSYRTKELIYCLKLPSESVDEFIWRLLMLNKDNLAVAGYQPDSTGLFFKRTNPDRLISEVATALDKRINSNHHSVKNYRSITRKSN